MQITENARRLWVLDREVFDYSTLPVVLDSVFTLPYEEEVLRQAVAAWTHEIDYRRLVEIRIDERNRGFDHIKGATSDYNVEVSLIEDFGPSPSIYAALSSCPASYVTSWSKLPGVEPTDLFGSADEIWNRLFPGGTLDRSRCLSWSLLSGNHRVSPLALAKADPLTAELFVPSHDERRTALFKAAHGQPPWVVSDKRRLCVDQITARPLYFETLIGKLSI